jgi:hypothetical protein
MQNIFLKKTCIKGVRKGWLLSELKSMCDTLKLSTKGNKEELCKRISDFFATKGESTTFLDFVKDNNLESVKKFSKNENEIFTIEQINEAKQECLNYGYLQMYKYLDSFPSNFEITLEKIIFVLNKGHTELTRHLYSKFNKNYRILEIDNKIDELMLMFNPQKKIPQDNYIKYIELSKMLRENAELIKQIQLFNTF